VSPQAQHVASLVFVLYAFVVLRIAFSRRDK
jgi:hypothetical protein